MLPVTKKRRSLDRRCDILFSMEALLNNDLIKPLRHGRTRIDE